MRKYIFCLLVFQFTLLQAQRPGRSMRGNPNQSRGNAERVIQKFESQKFAGLFQYDAKKAIKKLKLKKSDSVTPILISKLNNYNSQIEQLKAENKDLLEGLDVVVNQNMETARASQNRDLMRETITMARDKLKPIIEQVRNHEGNLNIQMNGLLDEELNEKWLKYQKSEKEKLMPRRRSGSDARNRPDNYNNNQRRRRRG